MAERRKDVLGHGADRRFVGYVSLHIDAPSAQFFNGSEHRCRLLGRDQVNDRDVGPLAGERHRYPGPDPGGSAGHHRRATV